MVKQYSIAEARDSLARLVHSAEDRSPIVLTRRGRPVAVLMSYSEYAGLRDRRSFTEELARFRLQHEDRLCDLAQVFEDTRDRSAGREVVV